MILNHCHVGDAAYFKRLSQGEGDEDGSLAMLVPYLKSLGYDRAVTFAPFQNWMDEDPNAWLLKEIAGNPSFVPWATINAPGPAAVQMLRTYGPQGIKGIKFHPPITGIAINQPGLEDFYALAENWKLPILFHTGPHGWDLERYRPSLVGQVAAKHPQLPLIIEHLGGATLAAETWAVMERHPNVHGGLASCLLEEATWHVPTGELAARIRQFGAQRFVFGADFPYNSVDYNARSMEVLRSIQMPADDLEMILSGSLERLIAGVKIN